MVGELSFLLNPCIIRNESYIIRSVSLCLTRSNDFKSKLAKFIGLCTVMVNPLEWLRFLVEKISSQLNSTLCCARQVFF